MPQKNSLFACLLIQSKSVERRNSKLLECCKNIFYMLSLAFYGVIVVDTVGNTAGIEETLKEILILRKFSMFYVARSGLLGERFQDQQLLVHL